MSRCASSYYRHIRPGSVKRVLSPVRMLVLSLAFALLWAGPGMAAEDTKNPRSPERGEPAVLLVGAQGGAGQAASAGPEAEAKPRAATAPPIRLFGTVEFRSPIKNLPKWERVRGLEGKWPSFTEAGFDTKNATVRERWEKLKVSGLS